MPKAATKQEPQTVLLTAGRIIDPESSRFQEHLLLLLLGASALVHAAIFWIGDFDWLRETPPLIDEWVLDADLVSDFDVGAPARSALPDAKVAEEARAPERMLPQLPKKFSVPEEKKPEEAVAEEAEQPEQQVAKTEPPKEETKPEPQEDIKMRTDEQEANRLKKEDALKRLALEKLRLQEKTAKQAQAEEQDDLARIREELQKRQKLNSGTFASPAAKAAAQKYQGMLQLAVRRNYALPEAYNFKNADIRVIISISVNERGELLEMKIYKPSGDAVFDELALEAVRSSTPLPKPPQELVAQAILLNFTPKSF